ncbi:Ankyrin repeat-containing domain, partial [Trinorchestia longiramus]
QKIFAALKKNSLKELQKIVSCHLHLISWPHAIQKTSQDTVLHMASKYLCTSDILEYLLSEGASVCLDQRNCDGKRPLHEAAQSGSLVAVQLFIRAGATVDPLNRAEWTPLMMAASKPSLESVAITQELLATGSNASLLNKDGWSAGHICCRSGSVAVLVHLLASQPHCCCGHSKNGRTALHTA